MSAIHIGETIYQLRKKHGMTQDQLACKVGVSAGAVSKWENGNSAPDIFLLAPLARALHTTLDTLLSFQAEPSQEELARMKQELTGAFLQEGYAAGEARGRAYLHDYPNSMQLKLIAAGLNNMYLMMEGEFSEEFVAVKKRECLALLQEVADSRDPELRPQALVVIAYIEMGLGHYEESERALKELPRSSVDSMGLYPSLLLRQGKHDEAAKLCEGALLQHVNQSAFLLITMARISTEKQEEREAVCYLEAAAGLQSTFGTGMYSAAGQLARLHLKAGRREAAAKWFGSYAEGVLGAGYDYADSPFFGTVKLEVEPEGQRIVRKKLLQTLIDEGEFDSLAGIPEYDRAMADLKEGAAAL